ncbi:MAG: hypothetical protein IKL00_06020, partial [Oscillospiraceae bacterium]|nr:hypothetical protein [Oscillospiraceae bacterium]
ENPFSGKIRYVTLYIPVAKDYALNYDDSENAQNYTTDKTLTSATSTAVAAADSIIAENAGRLDHKKLNAYKDAICDLTSYNYDAAEEQPAYGNIWQMIYVFDGDPSTSVVCEGYSKAFQYLCDKTEFYGDISCYTITGALNGGHMWNIVTMEDGKNYHVDVTNSDEGTVGSDGGLFLAGGSGSPSSGYTFYAGSYRLTYAYDNMNPWGLDVMTLSSTGYSWETIDGDVTLVEDTYIPSGHTVSVTEGSTLTIPEGVKFTVNGTLNFLGTGQQLFGDFTGTGKIYVNGVEHVHDMSTNASYTKIEGDDENHLRVGACLNCPIGLIDSENGTPEPHTFNEKGFCTACDGYEPAKVDSDGTFGIANAGQLYWFADKVNNSYETFGTANAQLLADIVINDNVLDENGDCKEGNFRNWKPIGKGDAMYAGTFNGKSHEISGLYASRTATAMGLFGYASGDASISALGITDSYIEGGANTEAGGLIARNYAQIQNCYVRATVGGESTESGGLCGRNYGSIGSSYFAGNIDGAGDVGAICGRNYGTLSDCYHDSSLFSGD